MGIKREATTETVCAHSLEFLIAENGRNYSRSLLLTHRRVHLLSILACTDRQFSAIEKRATTPAPRQIRYSFTFVEILRLVNLFTII
jgi:hypothetical protein